MELIHDRPRERFDEHPQPPIAAEPSTTTTLPTPPCWPAAGCQPLSLAAGQPPTCTANIRRVLDGRWGALNVIVANLFDTSGCSTAGSRTLAEEVTGGALARRIHGPSFSRRAHDGWSW